MNKQLLKQKVRDATGNTAVLAELSDLLNLSENSLVAKTNGRREFKPSEIEKMRRKYRLTDYEVVEIFIKEDQK